MRTEHNMSAWKRGWRARADRVLARMTDRAIAVSEPVRTSLIEVSGFAPDRVVTIANGLNLRRIGAMAGETKIRQELGLSPASLVAGTSAALTPKKGHRYLLDAAALLRADFPGLHFLLLGEGELREEIAEGIRARNLQGTVHLLGSRPDALEIVAGLDVFVMSSVREGLSIALLEAMALERPVVVTAVGGAVDVIEDGVSGVLVPERDARALAAGITSVLSSPARSVRMGRRARTAVEERFDFDRMVRRYEEEYLRLVRPPGKRLPEEVGSGTMASGKIER